MGIRKLVVLVVVAGSFAVTSSANAVQLLLNLPVPPVLVVPVAGACPQGLTSYPGVTYNVCTFTPVTGTTVACISGTPSPFLPSLNGCGVTTPAVTLFCGETYFSGLNSVGSRTGCDGHLGTTPVNVGCTRTLSANVAGTLGTINCGAGPIAYGESNLHPPPPGSDQQTQTITVANVTYSCLNDVCNVVTS